jgi:hypothetical protein
MPRLAAALLCTCATLVACSGSSYDAASYQESYLDLPASYDGSYDQSVAYHNIYKPNELVTTHADGKPVSATPNLSPKAADYAYYEDEDASYSKAQFWENLAKDGPRTPNDPLYNADGTLVYAGDDLSDAQLAQYQSFMASYSIEGTEYSYSYDQDIAYHNTYEPDQLITTHADGKPVSATADLSPKAADYAYYEDAKASYSKAQFWENLAQEGPQKPEDDGIVFGESAKSEESSSASRAAATADALIVVGSVGVAAVALAGLVVAKRIGISSSTMGLPEETPQLTTSFHELV